MFFMQQADVNSLARNKQLYKAVILESGCSGVRMGVIQLG